MIPSWCIFDRTSMFHQKRIVKHQPPKGKLRYYQFYKYLSIWKILVNTSLDTENIKQMQYQIVSTMFFLFSYFAKAARELLWSKLRIGYHYTCRAPGRKIPKWTPNRLLPMDVHSPNTLYCGCWVTWLLIPFPSLAEHCCCQGPSVFGSPNVKVHRNSSPAKKTSSPYREAEFPERTEHMGVSENGLYP